MGCHSPRGKIGRDTDSIRTGTQGRPPARKLLVTGLRRKNDSSEIQAVPATPGRRRGSTAGAPRPERNNGARAAQAKIAGIILRLPSPILGIIHPRTIQITTTPSAAHAMPTMRRRCSGVSNTLSIARFAAPRKRGERQSLDDEDEPDRDQKI